MSDDIIVSIESQNDTINQFTIPSDQIAISSQSDPEIVTINSEQEAIVSVETQEESVQSFESSPPKGESGKAIEFTPESSSSIGEVGTIGYDDSYLYVCIAENTWCRILHESW